jgi:hypothetical protein
VPAPQVIPVKIISEGEFKKDDARIKANHSAVNGEHHPVGKPDHQRGGKRRGDHQRLA